jgi:putative protease
VDDLGKKEKAVKGQKVCIKLDKQIRASDRLYKVVNAEEVVS